MIKIIQFGEGNFLRTFVDHYFSKLNDNGKEYGVIIVKPRSHGNLDKFKKQNNKYNIVLRGKKDGKVLDEIYPINCVIDAVNPFVEWNKYNNYVIDPEVKIIISNTTEAGIVFNKNDCFDAFDGITYPAKLTKLLFSRYQRGLKKLFVLPTELIDNNGEKLKNCVYQYIDLWGLEKGFINYVEKNVVFVNNLVDRIVSGHPDKSEEFDKKLGYNDQLLSVGEPFGLWAIEKVDNIEEYIVEGCNGIDVVLTEDISYYKKRKVRVLNGSHTNMVPVGLMLGENTVFDCMQNKRICTYFVDTLRAEIIPFVSKDVEKTVEFANSVKERFENPYLNHKLSSIALNSISKWKSRLLDTFIEYYEKFNKIPKNIVIGFSYLMAMYSMVKKVDGKYIVTIVDKVVELSDETAYLDYFVNGNSIKDFIKNQSIWGIDFTKYGNFIETVLDNVKKIKQGIVLI